MAAAGAEAAVVAEEEEEKRLPEGDPESGGDSEDEGDSDSSGDGEDEEKENEAEIQRLEEQVGPAAAWGGGGSSAASLRAQPSPRGQEVRGRARRSSPARVAKRDASVRALWGEFGSRPPLLGPRRVLFFVAARWGSAAVTGGNPRLLLWIGAGNSQGMNVWSLKWKLSALRLFLEGSRRGELAWVAFAH